MLGTLNQLKFNIKFMMISENMHWRGDVCNILIKDTKRVTVFPEWRFSVCRWKKNISENKQFTIISLSTNFTTTFSLNCVWEIRYWKFCAHLVPKMVRKQHKIKQYIVYWGVSFKDSSWSGSIVHCHQEWNSSNVFHLKEIMFTVFWNRQCIMLCELLGSIKVTPMFNTNFKKLYYLVQNKEYLKGISTISLRNSLLHQN